MKAIILAGGEGSRLRPLSLMRPKPMLRLLGAPLLEHLIRLLQAHGFTEPNPSSRKALRHSRFSDLSLLTC